MERIFVSSTFGDMQQERDSLRVNLENRLQGVALKYGQYIRFIDLRWGVDTNSTDKSVLDICFEEIDKAKNNFLLLVGNNYGTKLLASERIDNQNETLSVTEQETRYYIENHYSQEGFCFCDKSNDECDVEIKAFLDYLKDTLEMEYEERRIKYREEEWATVENQLYIQYKNMFENRWGNENEFSEYDKERIISERFYNERGRCFGGREKLIEDYYDYIQNGSYVYVQGESGIGKSSIMSKLCLNDVCKENRTLFIACGSGRISHTILDVVNQIVEFLEKCVLAEEHIVYKDYKSIEGKGKTYIKELIKKINRKGQKVSLYIDALDKLEKNEKTDLVDLLYFDDNEVVKFHFSSTNKYTGGIENIKVIDVKYIHVNNREEIKQIVKKQLELVGKPNDYGDYISEAICFGNGQEMLSPMYINLITQHLLILDRDFFDNIRKNQDIINGIKAYIEELPSNITELIRTLIVFVGKRIGIDDITNNDNTSLNMAFVIARLPYGIRESDLLMTLNMEEETLAIKVMQFIYYLRAFTKEDKQGFITFDHDIIKTAMLHTNIDDKNKLKQDTLNFILTRLGNQNYEERNNEQAHKYIINGLSLAVEINDENSIKKLISNLERISDAGIKAAICRDIAILYDSEKHSNVFNKVFVKHFNSIVNTILDCVEYKDIAEMYLLRVSALAFAERFISCIKSTTIDAKSNSLNYGRLLSQMAGIYDDLSYKEKTIPYIIAATKILRPYYDELIVADQSEELYRIAQEYNTMLFTLNRAYEEYSSLDEKNGVFKEDQKAAEKLCNDSALDCPNTFKEFYDVNIEKYTNHLDRIFSKEKDPSNRKLNRKILSLEGKYLGNLGQNKMAKGSFKEAMECYERSYVTKRRLLELLLGTKHLILDVYDKLLAMIKNDSIDEECFNESLVELRMAIEAETKKTENNIDELYEALVNIGVAFKNIATTYFKYAINGDDNDRIKWLDKNYLAFMVSITTYISDYRQDNDNKETMIAYNRMIGSMIYKCFLLTDCEKQNTVNLALQKFIESHEQLISLGDYDEYIGGVKNGCILLLLVAELKLKVDEKAYDEVLIDVRNMLKNEKRWNKDVYSDVIDKIGQDKNTRDFIIRNRLGMIGGGTNYVR